MKVLRILSDVRLVIAELEVHLGEDVRNSPTLCAVVPGVAGSTGPGRTFEHARWSADLYENR